MHTGRILDVLLIISPLLGTAVTPRRSSGQPDHSGFLHVASASSQSGGYHNFTGVLQKRPEYLLHPLSSGISNMTTQLTESQVRRPEALKLPFGIRTPPGMLMLIFGVIVISLAVAFLFFWQSHFPCEELVLFKEDEDQGGDELGKEEEFESGVESPKALGSVRSDGSAKTFRLAVDVDGWAELAGEGELDLYSCYALSLGRHKLKSKEPVRFLPRLMVLAVLQILLGIVFISYFSGRVHFYPTIQDIHFRLVGGMLYAYSCWRFYVSMYDECREWILQLFFCDKVKSVSAWYVVPAIVGECINTFVAYIMMLVLYFIFCQCERPQDLLINCIAINFVSDIDNQLVADDDSAEAVENLRYCVARLGRKREKHQPIVAFLRATFPYLNKMFRWIVPITGASLAFLFSFAHEEDLCYRMQYVEPWPFCLGVARGELAG